MSDHAFLNPSSAALTVECAYSATMRATFPQPETEETVEGTAAHWVALEAPVGTKVGDKAPNGVVTTEEMFEGFDLVDSVLPKDARIEIHVEKRVGDPKTDNHGTPDVWWVADGTVNLVDYKFGHGAVYAFENWQGMDYLRHIHDGGVKFKRFRITIVQPRCYSKQPIDVWEGTLDDLRPYWTRLTTQYAQARGPYAVATPGAHCREHYCPGRHACPQLQKAAHVSTVTSRHAPAEEPTPENTGRELRILTEAKAILDARIDGLKEYAMSVISAGKTVPGWEMGRTRTRVVWGKPDAEIIALGAALGLPLSKPAAAITPGQAVKAGLPAAMLETFAKDLPGSPVLEEVNMQDIQRRLKNG